MTGVQTCALPIFTEKAVFEVTPTGLVLTEMFEGLTVDDIRSITEADFTVSDKVTVYRL